MTTPRLMDVASDFAFELRKLLQQQSEPELANQVDDLTIVDRCRCRDAFCATFHTAPRPQVSYGPRHRNLALAPDKGMLILDVVDERIVCVEILYRDELRTKIHAAIP